jgi:hypothetical protein
VFGGLVLTKSKSKGKRQRKELNHRVPDFKLVDCTPKPLPYKESQNKLEVTIKNEQ